MARFETPKCKHLIGAIAVAVIVLVAVWPLSSGASPVECARSFADLFDQGVSLKVVQNSTGREMQLGGRFQIEEVQGMQPLVRGELKIVGVPVDGGPELEVGVLRTEYRTLTKELEISNIGTFPDFQRQDVAGRATRLALEQFPEANAVTAKLTNDNARAFQAALKDAKMRKVPDALKQAFMATPTYKNLARQGFTEVDMNYSYYDPFESNTVDQIFLKVRRPKK